MRVFIPNDVSSAIEVGIHRLVKQNSDMQSKLDQITALLAPKTDEELKSLAIPFVIVAVVSGASKNTTRKSVLIVDISDHSFS